MAYRDPDRSKVYEAERTVFEGTVLSTEIGSRDAVALTERLLALPAVADVLSVPIAPRFKKGGGKDDARSWCDVGKGEIVFSFYARWWAITHEVAHALAPDDAHNSRFRGMHVRLVAGMWGPDLGTELFTAYTSAGLDVVMDGGMIGDLELKRWMVELLLEKK